MEDKQVGKSQESRSIAKESARLWKSKDFISSAEIWEKNSYLTMAAKMYEEAAKVYDNERWLNLEEIRKGPEAWFNAERIWNLIGKNEESQKARAYGEKSLKEVKLAERRENPIYPKPLGIFDRIRSLESRGEKYSPETFLKELEGIGYDFEPYIDPDINKNGFHMIGAFKGPALRAIFDRTQRTYGELEVKTKKVLAITGADCELCIEVVESILPLIFGKSTKSYSRRDTMSNYAEWIKKT